MTKKTSNSTGTFNLSAFDTVEPQNHPKPMNLVHPHEGVELISDGKPMTIFLVGAKSRQFRAAINNQARVESARRVKPLPSIEADELRSAKLLAHATTGWSNITWEDEEGNVIQLPYSHENAEMLYRERPWIREQVDSFVAHEKNFLSEPGKK